MNLLAFPLFFLATIFSFFIPGILCLSFIKKKFTSGEKLLLAWPLGVVVFILLSYIFGWMQFPFGVVITLSIASVYMIIRRKIFFSKIFSLSVDWWSVAIVLLGIISFVLLTFSSGIETMSGITFYNVNRIDGLVHLALIKNMSNVFPPLNPSLAGGLLRGYHYFYDFLLSRFVLFYHFVPRDLEFRLFPLFISLLFGISFYIFSSLITQNNVARRFILFFAFFGENAGFIYSYFAIGSWFGDIGFPFETQLILDPSVVISISVLLTGMFFLADKRKTLISAFLAGLCLGILSQIKVYAGLIGIGVLVAYAVYSVIRTKKMWRWYLISLGTTALLTVLTFFPNNLGAGALVIAPLLSYRHFIGQEIFNNLKWELTYQVYFSHNNYIRIAQKYAEAIAIFWILILGIRSIMFLFIGKIFKKAYWESEITVLLFSFFGVSVFLGSFFIQTVSVFDIMQFFWIAVAVIAIPSGICYGFIFQKLPILGKTGLLLFIFIFSAIPLVILTYTTFFASMHDFYPKQEVRFFRQVGKVVPTDSFITVIPPYDEASISTISKFQWYREPLVAALTGRSTYYEPAIAYYHIYSSLYEDRKQDIYDLAKAMEACNGSRADDILQSIGAPYVISFHDYSCIGGTKEVVQKKASSGIEFYQFQ